MVLSKNNIDRKQLMLMIYQIVILYRARIAGWEIHKIGTRKYRLSKSYEDIDEYDPDEVIVMVQSIISRVTRVF